MLYVVMWKKQEVKYMIIGLMKEDWMEQLGDKKTDRFLTLIDKIVVVGKTKSNEDPYYFVNEDYDKVKRVLSSFSNIKAYPQRLWWSTNYSFVEIEEGVTPEILRKRWIHELQTRNLV